MLFWAPYYPLSVCFPIVDGGGYGVAFAAVLHRNEAPTFALSISFQVFVW
jgi:hypothetical protein